MTFLVLLFLLKRRRRRVRPGLSINPTVNLIIRSPEKSGIPYINCI
jgi:hypothetical protein